MDVQKFVTALEDLENPDFKDKYELESWKTNVRNILNRLPNQGVNEIEALNKIEYKITHNFLGDSTHNLPNLNKQAHDFIIGIINNLMNFGLPQSKAEKKRAKKAKHFNINVNQNQSQSQTVNINIIWEAIKDELTGKQVKEVEEILQSDEKPEIKKNMMLEKIKSFGSDVASNIIAGIITNPALWG